MDIKYFEEKPDIDTYYELRTSVGWNNFCKEQTQAAINNRSYFLLAKDDTEVVAMGSVVGDGMYFTIVDVIVRPDYQGHNIGATIVNKLVELIRKDIPAEGRICIQLISAKDKEQFYLKQGFDMLPCEDSGPALRKLIYT